MSSTAPRIIIVPGWRNSSPEHWQSLWAQTLPNVERVEQNDWLTPKREDWVRTLEALILSRPEPVIVVAHSLGCITTTHLGAEAAARIRSALLVAPADPERRAHLADFAPVPYQLLPYRSVLVASSNDPYCPIPSQVPTRAPGAANLCVCKMRGTSMWNRAMAHGRWALPCCSR